MRTDCRATLLLNHSPSQTLNQQRLETYLSSYGQSSIDLSDDLQRSSLSDVGQRPTGPGSGTSTPKDLAARVRIIELFTLLVLPRNEEWEYAREFISLSEVLDEERKEAFLQTLEGLKEEKEMGDLRAAEIQRGKEAELAKQAQEAQRRVAEEAAAAERLDQNSLKRAGAEGDFGIEKSRPTNGSAKTRGSKSSGRQSGGAKTTTATGRSSMSPSSSGAPKNVKKTEKPAARSGQLQTLANAIRNILRHVTQAATSNPLSVFRTLLFILGIIVAFSRQKVRERIGRVTGAGWQKVKGTIGMGVKVSYI